MVGYCPHCTSAGTFGPCEVALPATPDVAQGLPAMFERPGIRACEIITLPGALSVGVEQHHAGIGARRRMLAAGEAAAVDDRQRRPGGGRHRC